MRQMSHRIGHRARRAWTRARPLVHGAAMDAAFVLYPSFTALDVVGPFQVLSSVPGVECVFVAESPGPVVDHTGTLTLVAERALAEVARPDLVVMPGNGSAPMPTATGPLVEWLRAVHPSTLWTTSV